MWTPKLRNFAPSTCGPQRAKTPTWSRSPGIHGAHSRGSRSGGRTDSPRVCGGSCGHGSCAEQDGRRNRPRAPQTSRAPQVWSERGGRAKRLCSVPRTGQSYVTLGSTRVDPQNHLVGDRWCPHVWTPKLPNFSAGTCGHQRSSAWHVGVHTCWGQSYVTLGSTRVDPQSPPDRVVLGVYTCGVQSYVTLGSTRVDPQSPPDRVGLGVYTCGGQSYVTLGSTRVDPKVPPKSVGVNTCSPQSYVTLPPARYGGNKWVRSRGLPTVRG